MRLYTDDRVGVSSRNAGWRRLTVLPALAAAVVFLSGCAFQRPEDPIVLKGSETPRLVGAAPGKVLAFRYLNGRWDQVPVQVDERALIDLGTVYNESANGVKLMTYTDPNTFAGADPDPTIDANDEIVLMGIDGGSQAAPGSNPPGVVAGSGEEIRFHDPVGDPTDTFAYLYRQTGNLDQSAGRPYVDYDFNLLSGNYKSTYRLQDGPNPEDSTVRTNFYTRHFSDRWADDGLKIIAPGASGVDILDRHKNLFAPGNCGRSEDTFDDAEGAFIVNKSGPVRAIRSYIGANSGPLTARQHIFYDRREDITTTLRVHAIPGVMDFFDYSPAANGMTYRSDVDPRGATIDGAARRRQLREDRLGDGRRPAGGPLDGPPYEDGHPVPGVDLVLLRRQNAGHQWRGEAVHRRRCRVRFERALHQPGHSEHRSPRYPVQLARRRTDGLLRVAGQIGWAETLGAGGRADGDPGRSARLSRRLGGRR